MATTNVQQTQLTGPSGDLVNGFEITYTITLPDGKESSVTFDVPAQPDPVTAAQEQIAAFTQQIEGLYAL